MELSWQPNTPDDPQRWHEGPVDQPPWAAGGQAPIPPYAPPQPGRWSPQDTPTATPDPAPPQPHLHSSPQQHLRYAEWGERVGATFIDGLLIAALLVLLSAATPAVMSGLVGLVWLAATGYVAWLNGSKGQSPGKALTGLKVVRDADGSPLGGPVGVVRVISLWLMGVFSGGLLFVLAVLWPAWDRKKQGLHDKLFGATVVAGYPRAKFGRDLFRP